MMERSTTYTFDYDQAEVIVSTVKNRLDDVASKSLLDIGAGRISTAVPIAEYVERYVAVEKNPDSAVQLREAGLEVIEGRFDDILIDEDFGCVLSSHSIPEIGLEKYKAFLNKAWERVSFGGLLLIVTFKGSFMEQHKLRAELTGEGFDPGLEYETMMSILRSFGSPDEDYVTSTIKTSCTDTLMSIIEPVVLRTSQERYKHKDALKNLINTRYRNADGLIHFPTRHLVISLKK